MAQNLQMQQRLAEKLIILNEHAVGMLVRIYNIKRVLAEFRPEILKDKAIQAAIEKVYLKKFPLYDSKASQLTVVNQKKEDILQALSLFYLTFVEILTLKDQIVELLTTIDALQFHFDIVLNFDLTKNYLELVTSYITLMILISQVDDRKAVLSLYNNAFELKNSKSDPSYHRLGQMLIDYEAPLKKLTEEFVPHSRHVIPALKSLHKIYTTRNLSAEELRTYQVLAIFYDSSKMANIPSTEMIQCEYLSLETMERWIVFGFLVCNQGLSDPSAVELWKLALQSNLCFTLYRTDMLLYSDIINFFENMKGQNKRASEVKEFQIYSLQNSAIFHKERRKFLRNSLRDLSLAFAEHPGLLGPKALYVFQGLSLARDEILWLLRHIHLSTLKKQNMKISPDDFTDRQLPELIFYMEDIKVLVKKYKEVVQSYYSQYLSGYDSVLLQQLMSTISLCPPDELVLLNSFVESLSGLQDIAGNDYNNVQLKGFRLDWFRFQAMTSGSKVDLELKTVGELAKHMNTVIFHTKMVDSLDEMLEETTELSIYCFHTPILEHHFNQCMEFLPQHRYSLVFPLICSHFMMATHSHCPEERMSIGNTSLKYINWFLKHICNEIVGVVTKICAQNVEMDQKLLPSEAVPALLYQQLKTKDKEKKDKKLQEPSKPGIESIRKNREQLSNLDKYYMALTDLCYAINYSPVISVWDHCFIPQEFLLQTLEAMLTKVIADLTQIVTDGKTVAKPKDVLCAIQSHLNILQNVGNFVHLDISRLLRKVLLEQSQPVDSNGEKTITSKYKHWYVDVLMTHVLCNFEQMTYSPTRKSIICLAQSHVDPLTTAAEDFINIQEFRALAELIGPYGMKYVEDQMIYAITAHFDEIKKLVKARKDILIQVRTNFDKPGILDLVNQKLMTSHKNTQSDGDVLLSNLIKIGLIMAVHSLLKEALNDVLTQRIPYLLGAIQEFQDWEFQNNKSLLVTDLLSSIGVKCPVDPSLLRRLQSVYASTESNKDDYDTACLLLVFLAISLPRLVYWDQTIFKASLDAHFNSSHCIAYGLSQVSGALFSLYGPDDAGVRLKEFLNLASSSLLQLSQQNDKDSARNRESVYLILDQIVKESTFLTMDQLESCFPYVLLRNAYHGLYKVTPSEL
ncbi:nck-associated protein 1-like isoform X2 [Biomphalaria glabrata]|uniref:Nck-associated protein 1-like isoform X2 n=1 Tax=Biomphalaria glabrata TaxID=6526 RepID=A0A9W3BN08_BIOGL|nr:nck-associated protein 1-like isoform X2 [Biomphalaria glabrata]